jgi:prolyl oligopeptidase
MKEWKNRSVVASSLRWCALAALLLGMGDPPAASFSYPPARRGDAVDTLHEVSVPDPYRWLEDSDSPESRTWIEAENRLAFGFLEGIPQRESIRERITKLWDYEKQGVPLHVGSSYFVSKNDGLQNQEVLYTMSALTEPPRVLIDPNTLSPDGTVALGGHWPSEDGRTMAYALAEAGSDWRDIRVLDVATGKQTGDLLQWVKFSGASWTHDGKGFYYSRYDEPKEEDQLTSVLYYQKLFYHRVGTPQSRDELIYENPREKEWGFGGDVTEDGRYLLIYVSHGTERKNLLYYRDLQDPSGAVVKLIDSWDARFNVIGNDGPVFYVFTDYEVSRARVIAIDTRSPAREGWRDVVPQTKDTLTGATMFQDFIVCTYLADAHSKVSIHNTGGRHVRDLRFPTLGTVSGFSGRRKDTETFYAFTSFTTPTAIYRLDVPTGESTVHWRPKVDVNPDDYEVEQIFYRGKDGTRIPMFLTHRKGLQRDGNNMTYLYGYGGFNIPITPAFRVENLVWMELGGLFAVANIRGGGEYGRDWHEAGKKLNRQNVFDDFIAAGEWLIRNGYTKPSRLAIGGASNGGLLVGACMTQRPELFGACLPAVGVLDMLRFHKFTIGWAWTSDYGHPDNAEEFRVLHGYSPYHNVKPGTQYPATMITTADHDDRVVPAHSFKFAAALQAAQSGPAPVLIRIETRAGHGAGKPTGKRIEEYADRWAFLMKVLGGAPATKPADASTPATQRSSP